jgi:hypothetical protein
MKESREMKAIDAIETTLIALDVNYHKPLIDILNEYNKRLKVNKEYVSLGKLKSKISWCILQNKLKVPPEVSELMTTLTSLQSKVNLLSSILMGWR